MKMKKSILFAVLIAGALFLAGCEGGGTVQSGVGNADDDGIVSDNIDEGPDNDLGIDPFTGEPGDEADNPYSCPVPETIIRSDCSIKSQMECSCMLP